MLNKFESVKLTSSPKYKSFDSSMKQNVGQLLLTVQCMFAETYFEKDEFYVIWNYQNPEKNDNFGKSSKFPGFPVALLPYGSYRLQRSASYKASTCTISHQHQSRNAHVIMLMTTKTVGVF